MDIDPSSRKRNRASATLTRSRSQLLLHRNRSGQLRFDPVPTDDEPHTVLFPFHRTNSKKPKREHGEPLRHLMKDLRARRVYSPPQSTNSSLIEGAFLKGTADDSDCTDKKLAEGPDMGLSREARSFDLGNPEEGRKFQDCKGNNNGYCLEKIDGLDVKALPKTLLDSEVCVASTSKVNVDEADITFKDTPTTGIDNMKNDSSLVSQTVLRPRFQGKLFKIPGSVNYRRLFTFLRDSEREDSATPKLGFGQKNESGEQDKQHPLPSQNQEASKEELKTDGCATHEEKCLSELKVDSTADNGVNVFRSDLPNDGFNQLSSHTNGSDCNEPSHNSACSSGEFGLLNEKYILTTPANADIYDNSEVNAKPMDFTRSTQGHAGELFSFKADKGKDFFKSKSVPRQNLHKKLFINPGSVSYKRLLPFLTDLTKDDSDRSKFDHQTRIKDGKEDVHPKRFQLPLSSQTEEASIDEHKTDSSPMHGADESNGVENCVLIYTSNELSHVILTPSQDLPELPVQWDSKEEVGDGLSAPSVNELMEKIVKDDECLTASELNPCSVMEVDFHSAKIVANVVQNAGRQESRRHKSESPLKDRNRPFVNGVDENKQFVNLEECESVDENVTSLNHVRVSNDLLRSLYEKIISGKYDMGGHSGDEVGSMRNDIVICSTMPSEGSNNNASEIKNEFESKITSVLRRCLQFKLLKQAGSLNCKRLFPFLLNSNSGTQHQIELNNDSSSQKFQIPEFQSSRDSWEVTQLQDERVASNGLCKIESSTYPSVSDHEIELPIITKEKATPPLSKSSIFSETRGTSSCLISCGKQPETHKCGQSLSQLKVVGQLGGPAVGFRKGILKRNPRGCRGLCTCLNCVSFRLHAERAFEFSKNQLLDAEEVAHDLMKELSLLRNMLEKSADSVNINPVFDGSQVRQACRKAFAAEKTAKDRLSQMHDDLNIHSRITSLKAPKVTFALNVEEKIFQPGR
ncbi:uncharacterized protein LOC114179935 isoform X2 [Vigna unguiculata]|uniref:uncharacterized protein LOC114179935 isoform X2 n=1 Tax=Vigna unguiculata TaxID=3917 RepID=UPI001016D3E8|nr:uncharacterized protein LOC114179935 isoform X2 [Vigna unguiculata]